MSSRQQKKKQTRHSRLQCGTVPFQRVPSQKSRGDPSRTPPSSHLMSARSLIIEILVLRSEHPMNFTKRENQKGIITVSGYGDDFVSHWKVKTNFYPFKSPLSSHFMKMIYQKLKGLGNGKSPKLILF